MRELSLFSGAGGGLLATKHLLGWTTAGYVEIEPYCQAVLAQRIADGYLDPAPIFGDIRQFISEGYAEAYQGMVDVITAGVPCQAFSISRLKNLKTTAPDYFPDTLECVRLVRPSYVYLENVPNLLNNSRFGKILTKLAFLGYNTSWGCISAKSVGSNHTRNRLWIVAYPAKKGQYPKAINQRRQITRCSWWFTEPRISRVDDGVAYGVDRRKMLGEGQVPRVVEVAWKILSNST